MREDPRVACCHGTGLATELKLTIVRRLYEGDGDAPAKGPPANPFAKGAAKGADTLKGPKRALPVTSAVGGGKKLKK